MSDFAIYTEGRPMTTTPGPRTEPRTEAGRAMLYDWQKRRTHPPTEARQESYRQFILAIEAEARTDVDGLDAERLARAMARLAEVGPPAHIDIGLAEEHWPSYLMEAQEVAREYALLAGDKAEFGTDAHDLSFDGDKAEAPLLTVGIGDTLLVKLSEDDIMYDHPVSSMQEPADPVLFVRWDAILALLHPTAGDKAEAPE